MIPLGPDAADTMHTLELDSPQDAANGCVPWYGCEIVPDEMRNNLKTLSIVIFPQESQNPLQRKWRYFDGRIASKVIINLQVKSSICLEVRITCRNFHLLLLPLFFSTAARSRSPTKRSTPPRPGRFLPTLKCLSHSWLCSYTTTGPWSPSYQLLHLSGQQWQRISHLC